MLEETHISKHSDAAYLRTNGERLARIETQLEELNRRIDEVVVGQVRDHGKRIAALERRGTWMAGWIAGAAAVGGAVGVIIQKVF